MDSSAVSPDRFQLYDCIGRGSFGAVYRGWDTEQQREVAVKIIELEEIEDDIEDIHKEISMLAQCKSKHITDYYTSVLSKGSSRLLIVMELMAASVADLLDANKLSEDAMALVLREILMALVYLHSENRIHRDIKAANILLSADGGVKMSDFGVAGQLTSTLGYKRKSFVGTPFWMAPEVIQSSEEGYTEKADIWSLGITAIEIATGAPPHAEIHPMRVLFLIPKNPPPVLEGPFSDKLKHFVACCLQKSPRARPTAKELLNHPLFQDLDIPHSMGQLSESIEDFQRSGGQRVASPHTGGTNHDTESMPRWDFETAAAPIEGGSGRETDGMNGGAGAGDSGPVGAWAGFPGESGAGNDDYDDDDESEFDLESLAHPVGLDLSRDSDDAVAQSLRTPAGASLSALNGDGEQHHQAWTSGTFVDRSSAGGSSPSPPSNHGGSGLRAMPDLSRKPMVTPSQPQQRPSAPGGASPSSRASWQQQQTAPPEPRNGALDVLLEPALRQAGDGGPEAREAAQAVQEALRRLEEARPGSCELVLGQSMAMLQMDSSRPLERLRNMAYGLFRGASSGGDGSGEGAAASEALPELGPLGHYLMARWKQGVTSSRPKD